MAVLQYTGGTTGLPEGAIRQALEKRFTRTGTS